MTCIRIAILALSLAVSGAFAQTWDYFGNRLWAIPGVTYVSIDSSLFGYDHSDLILRGPSLDSLSSVAPPGRVRITSLVKALGQYWATTIDDHIGWDTVMPMLHSPDGIHWSSVTPAAPNGTAKLFAIGSHLVGKGQHGVFSTTDGANWSPMSTLQGTFAEVIVADGAAMFALGPKHSFRSSDFATWTKDTLLCPKCDSKDARPNPIFKVGSSWVGFFQDDSEMVVSTDGTHWTTQRLPGITSLTQVALGSGRLVATGWQSGTSRVLTSTDGVQWTSVAATIGHLVQHRGTWLSIGTDSVWTSVDGTHWSPWSAPRRTIPVMPIAYSDGNAIIGFSTDSIFRSTDGKSWTPLASTVGKAIQAMCTAGPLHVAVGNAGNIMTSPDGVTWTTRSSGTTQALKGVDYSGSFHFAWGDSVLLRSSDGVSWSKVGLPMLSGSTVQSVAWQGDHYLMSDQEAYTLYSSTNGSSWAQEDIDIPYSYARFLTDFVRFKGTLLMTVYFAGPGSYSMDLWSSGATDTSWTTMDGFGMIRGIEAAGDTLLLTENTGSPFSPYTYFHVATGIQQTTVFLTPLTEPGNWKPLRLGGKIYASNYGLFAQWNPAYDSTVPTLGPWAPKVRALPVTLRGMRWDLLGRVR